MFHIFTNKFMDDSTRCGPADMITSDQIICALLVAGLVALATLLDSQCDASSHIAN